MIKNLSVFCLLLISFSCSEYNEKEFYLTEGNIKYWDLLSLNESKSIFNQKVQCWKFTTKGKFYTMFFRRNGRLISSSLIAADIVEPNTWDLKNNTLALNNKPFTIIFLNNDTLKLKGKNKPYKLFLLIRSDMKKQIECLDIDCIQTSTVTLPMR